MYSDWKPRGIGSLEPSAWKALTCLGNACVTAGPGAGKTELLAQKTAFMLENDICPEPKQILAISFKTDAAENLAGRVTERCSQKHAMRFDSMTFDAFTKSLVDRFQLCLPEEWQLKDNYEIISYPENQYREFLANMRDGNSTHAQEIEAIQTSRFQHQLLGTYKISTDEPGNLLDQLSHDWLARAVKGNVDFLVLNRLAEFILRSNPYIAQALALTYELVLVDEFQDTTYAQYDFLSTLLKSSDSKAIVVGDNKQRIMSWAGAKPNSFKAFVSEFRAEEISLQTNYRSSPELVRIHHTLARSLEPSYIPYLSAAKAEIAQDVAEIWNFPNAYTEHAFIATWVAADMKNRSLAATDYGILVKQKAADIYPQLAKEFDKEGLVICNETQRYGKFSLQDIASDDLFLFWSSVLRLSIEEGCAAAWETASSCLDYFFPMSHNDAPNQKHLLDNLIEREIQPRLSKFDSPKESINECLQACVDWIGESTIRNTFPQHSSKANLSSFLDASKQYLYSCANQSKDWNSFIDKVDRLGQIPLLTVHKSKGLEYDTVIFMGLDDSAWWSYSEANPEGKATFFVGLSRAKQRVIFTHCRSRGRDNISELYRLLAAAGVPEKTI